MLGKRNTNLSLAAGDGAGDLGPPLLAVVVDGLEEELVLFLTPWPFDARLLGAAPGALGGEVGARGMVLVVRGRGKEVQLAGDAPQKLFARTPFAHGGRIRFPAQPGGSGGRRVRGPPPSGATGRRGGRSEGGQVAVREVPRGMCGGSSIFKEENEFSRDRKVLDC